MKKIILLAFIALGCTDKNDKCYKCEVVFSNKTYDSNTCGFTFASGAEAYIRDQYEWNTVINGGTFKKVKCKRKFK